MAGFIGQEATHGREHRAFNERLAELGYPVKRTERFIRRVLTLRERIFTPRANLAETAAAEHFTATLAELLLSTAEVRDRIGDPEVRDLFLWHALEESEHKAVAFDVYRAVGGSEWVRILTMRVLMVVFIVSTGIQTVLSILGDPATYRPGVLARSLVFARRSPIFTAKTWGRLAAYNRRGFHPTIGTRPRSLPSGGSYLFGDDGEMVDKLATAAA